MPSDRVLRQDLLAGLTTITFAEADDPIASSPAANIVGAIVGYNTGLAILMFLSGLDDFGCPN